MRTHRRTYITIAILALTLCVCIVAPRVHTAYMEQMVHYRQYTRTDDVLHDVPSTYRQHTTRAMLKTMQQGSHDSTRRYVYLGACDCN